MKRKLLSLLAIFIGVGFTLAQPTFNSADEPTVGASLNYYLGDTTNFDMQANNSGANVTWDWSAWGANTVVPTRTADVFDASGDPIYAPLGTTQNFDIQDYINQYINFDASVKHSQGFRYSSNGNEIAVIKFDSASYNVMEYPFDYTDLINNTISADVTVDVAGVGSQNDPAATGSGTIEYDAYGTLVLYDTIFTNVARIHQNDFVSANFGFIGADITVDKYEYYDLANLNIPIFICSIVTIDAPISIPPVVSVYSVVPFAPSNASLTENSAEKSIAIFPNPANDRLTIKFSAADDSDDEIRLVDLSGKMVKLISNGFSKGINTLNVDVTDITKGVYILEFTMDSQTVSKKVVIQ